MQPVSLITASVINAAAEISRTQPESWKDPETVGNICDATARRLLCSISHDAPMPMVMRALAALDAPGSRAEFTSRINAAADGLRKEIEGHSKEAAP